jgi:hypothetical protein
MRAFEIADAIPPLSLSMYGLVSVIGGFMDRFDELPWWVTRPSWTRRSAFGYRFQRVTALLQSNWTLDRFNRRDVRSSSILLAQLSKRS